MLTSCILNNIYMNLHQAKDLITKINTEFTVNITENSRKRYLVDIRHCLMYSLRKRGYGLTFIAKMLGKNHATVIHAVKKIDALFMVDKDFTKLCEAVEEVIDNYFLDNHIHGKNLHSESYESMKMASCRLINEYVESEPEIERWLLRFNITWSEYRTFTSRQL